MHRHAVGDRRPPAGIGAGVEIAVEDHAGDAAVGVGADASRVIAAGWRLVVDIIDSVRV